MWLTADVAVGDGDGFEFATATGGNHDKEEDEFDLEMGRDAWLRGLKGGPDRRHRTEGRSDAGIRCFSGDC